MSTGTKILFALISLLILGVLLLIHASPPPIDWSPSYEQNDTRPFGAKVFYDLIKKGDSIWKDVNRPPYEWIEEAPSQAIYVFVNQYFDSDPEETEKLINWVESGGHLFISAADFSEPLLDSLSIKTKIFPEDFSLTRISQLSLEKPMHLPDSILFEEFNLGVYFKWGDSVQVSTLGKIQSTAAVDTLGAQPNFIQIRKGSGLVTLHAFPEAFSNYFLLDKNNKVYTEQVLGTWDSGQPVFLDQYIKIGKNTNLSPLYLILSNKYLSAAYFTCWILLVLWVVFEGKRRQKAINVIYPPQNKSLEFAKTIASMYLKQPNMTELGHLQIKLFWDYCRTHFLLQMEENKMDGIILLSEKSGVDLELSKATVLKLTELEKRENLGQEDIQHIHQTIEKFKSQQQYGRNLQHAR
ncbi:hypothetical protein C943_02450 [Mariniradius saccharolyticus AK6]|uniref:DUF4350 domain-containing protein n=1 Tax=Mariniradius saccharolyticus AK6 TaxID=1239962 RepID=M7X9F9_9BACT|nr:DUF4350 domain-containing protein [Mariniradius saccharolyticus]EMS31303.1 hypothetical protein C943_02450 [Mariniradius saccharolyticus AK6]